MTLQEQRMGFGNSDKYRIILSNGYRVATAPTIEEAITDWQYIEGLLAECRTAADIPATLGARLNEEWQRAGRDSRNDELAAMSAELAEPRPRLGLGQTPGDFRASTNLAYAAGLVGSEALAVGSQDAPPPALRLRPGDRVHVESWGSTASGYRLGPPFYLIADDSARRVGFFPAALVRALSPGELVDLHSRSPAPPSPPSPLEPSPGEALGAASGPLGLVAPRARPALAPPPPLFVPSLDELPPPAAPEPAQTHDTAQTTQAKPQDKPQDSGQDPDEPAEDPPPMETPGLGLIRPPSPEGSTEEGTGAEGRPASAGAVDGELLARLSRLPSAPTDSPAPCAPTEAELLARLQSLALPTGARPPSPQSTAASPPSRTPSPLGEAPAPPAIPAPPPPPPGHLAASLLLSRREPAASPVQTQPQASQVTALATASPTPAPSPAPPEPPAPVPAARPPGTVAAVLAGTAAGVAARAGLAALLASVQADLAAELGRGLARVDTALAGAGLAAADRAALLGAAGTAVQAAAADALGPGSSLLAALAARTAAEAAGARALSLVVRLQARARGLLARRRWRPALRRRMHRWRLARELVQTEAAYVANLRLMQAAFATPLRAHVTPAEHAALFANLDELIAVNSSLADALAARLAAWGPAQTVGDVMAAAAPGLEVYSAYINNFGAAVAVLARCRERPEVAACLEAAGADPALARRDLPTFQILPVQRIPRYELLLRELAEATPAEHPDHSQLARAAAAVRQVNSSLNESKRAAEALHALAALEASLEERPAGLRLAEPGRRLLRDGPLLRDRVDGVQGCQVHLLSDMLLVVQRRRLMFDPAEHTVFVACAALRGGTVEQLGPADIAKDYNHGIKLTTPHHRFIFYTDSFQSAADWVQAITAAIKALEDAVAPPARSPAPEPGSIPSLREALALVQQVIQLQADLFLLPIDLKTLIPTYYHTQVPPDYLATFQTRARALMGKLEQLEPLQASIQRQVRRDLPVALLNKSLAEGMNQIGLLKDWVVELQRNPNQALSDPGHGKELVRGLLHWFLTFNEHWERVLEAPLT